MRHRLRTRILASVAAVGVMGAVIAVVASPDDEQAASSTTSTIVATRDLDPAAQELVDLLQLSRTTAYHARYQGTSPELGGSIILETWQMPPRVRQDSELVADDSTIRTRTIGDDSGVIRCGELDGTWTCRRQPGAPDPLGPVNTATIQQLTSGSVGVRDSSIDGAPVRCFTLRADGGSSELCASIDGIVIRVSSAGSEIELVELERDPGLGDETFEPPAQVGS